MKRKLITFSGGGQTFEIFADQIQGFVTEEYNHSLTHSMILRSGHKINLLEWDVDRIKREAR